MIKEDYVSFEIAELLKEKGFEGECQCFYEISPEDGITRVCGTDCHDNKKRMFEYSRPTLQMAMKWLREKHNKIIVPGIRVDDQTSSIINCYIVGIWYVPKNNGGAFCYTSPTPYNGYSSFEEACEAGIKYCLENLI